jgi:signal transduction histidine kinase
MKTAGHGEIRITAARSGHRVRIDIADTGPGLSPAARERLFQPFATVGRAQGTGLGLLIARELVRGHGGDLVLVKSDERGTTFRLELPD